MKAINLDVDVSDFSTIENLIWLEQKPLIEMGFEPKILHECIIEEELFEFCSKFIGSANPINTIFGK